MAGCKFCEALENKKRFSRYWAKRSRERPRIGYKYSVALVSRVTSDGRITRSRELDFRNQGCGYTLNFCPECGKPLKRRNKNNEQ